MRRDEHTIDGMSSPLPAKIDAGALFALKSRGSWLHCGYHLTTSIVAPALLSLPFAFASLKWVARITSLIVRAAVTFYSYNLLSLVMEHHAQLGRRQFRFKDMSTNSLATTAIIKVPRNAPLSNSRIPAMVVPPGDVTPSFSCPGYLPVFSIPAVPVPRRLTRPAERQRRTSWRAFSRTWPV
ncbi:GABA transporter 1 [Acorus calamus]|uniref:GABA transporter 1 n=1 Tax=Acorus calamus TaxID=4465 RepID=A0AAV9FA16_ACOCL|nr:GABA transporter 1 [Acorus calamus]